MTKPPGELNTDNLWGKEYDLAIGMCGSVRAIIVFLNEGLSNYEYVPFGRLFEYYWGNTPSANPGDSSNKHSDYWRMPIIWSTRGFL